MTKKKILFMLYNMNLGGTEKSFLNLMDILPNSYEITLLLISKSGSLIAEIPRNVEIIEIKNAERINNFIQKDPITSILGLIKNKKIIRACHSAINYIKWKLKKDYSYNFRSIDYILPSIDKKFDIAIAYAGPYDFISYFIAHKVRAKKKVQWIHFDVSKINFNKITSQKLYTHFDEINVVSKDVKKQLLLVLPNIKNKVRVFNNIIPEKLIHKMAKSETAFNDKFVGLRIVTVGRLSKEKGHELFIPAMKKLIDQNYNIRWYLVGDGAYRSALENMITKYSLKNHIVLLGSKKNPYPFINEASIYLQPSYYEGHCVTILEAKVLNKPIISTNFSGVNEEIESGENGLIVETDTESLYLGMKLLLNNKKILLKYEYNLKESNLKEKKHQLNFLR